MYQIQQITNDPLQVHNLSLPDGSAISFTMYFMPMQLGWFIRNLTYGDFQLNNLRICVSPNMLYQWKNKLPFGLACFSKGSREPSLQDDFLSGAASLYILTEEEVAEYAEILSE